MIARWFDFKFPEDKIIVDKIYYTGCEFIKAAFGENDAKGSEVEQSLWEVTIKLSKVVAEIKFFQAYNSIYEQKLIEETKNNITAIPTLELARCIENFLTQSIGALDIFATQFLKALFNYSYRDWNHEKIIRHLEKQTQLDKEAVHKIKQLLENAWNEWLEKFNDDRNLHHEKNFGLSLISLIDGKPHLVLSRRDGTKTADVLDYLVTHWNKLFWLIENMIRLSFWALRPDRKIFFFSQFTRF